MKSYPSIETIFVRDKETNRLRFGEVRLPEVAVIKDWTVSEKIDGTNIRVIVTHAGVEVKGRTDNANLHPDLVVAVKRHFDHAALLAYFATYRGNELPPEWSVTFYGEGYGAGIQKGGVYAPDKRFRCFDLMLGGGWWVDDEEMRRVCADLRIPVAPFLGYITELPDTEQGLLSIIPESSVAYLDRGMNGVRAEGIVAKPRVVLKDRHGSRVVWKLTFREFEKAARAAA